MKKVISRILSVLFVALIALEVTAMLSLLTSKIKGQTPSILGYSLYVVVTGSMEPYLKPGDIIVTKEYNGEELTPNEDIISYIAQEGAVKGSIVTHRYIRTNEDGKIVVKGDANNVEDKPFDEKYIVSLFVYKTFLIGPLYKVLTSNAGFLLLVIIPIALMIIYEFVNIAKIKYELKEENENEKVNEK